MRTILAVLLAAVATAAVADGAPGTTTTSTVVTKPDGTIMQCITTCIGSMCSTTCN